ncbi:putative transcription factor, K-box [Helianthus anomalus]
MKLRKGQRLMMGKELEGLNYKELENLERQLHDGMLAVKNRKDMALLEEIEQIKLREQRTMKENEALKKEITKHLYKSTSGHEICLVGRKSPFIKPSTLAYLSPENGDVGISLHLGYVTFTIFIFNLIIFSRVKCHFSPCGLGYFGSLVQKFHFSHVGSKRFHRCHFCPLG